MKRLTNVFRVEVWLIVGISDDDTSEICLNVCVWDENYENTDIFSRLS